MHIKLSSLLSIKMIYFIHNSDTICISRCITWNWENPQQKEKRKEININILLILHFPADPIFLTLRCNIYFDDIARLQGMVNDVTYLTTSAKEKQFFFLPIGKCQDE